MGNPAHQGVLQGVRKRTVAHVVQKDGQTHSFLFFGRNGMTLATEYLNGPLHEVHGPQSVVKTRVVGPRVHEVTQSQLGDAPQALEGRMFEYVENLRRWQGNKPVDGVVKKFKLVGFYRRSLHSAK